MDIQISKTVEEMPPSGIRAFFDMVLQMKDVISLGVGEPDFVTPWHIREKAISSLEEGVTSYTSNKGMIELRKQIAKFLKQRFGLVYDPEEEILITVGVSEGLDLAMRAMLNPGDSVIVPEPVYVSYAPVVSLAYGRPIQMFTSPKDGFKITPQQIEKHYVKGTRAIMINYPCNPTGVSYSKKELTEIARIVKKLDMVMISDEIYDELTYDFDHTPMATLPGMKERTLYFNGFSKAYAMTGFRIGYVCGPAKLVGAMTKIHQYTMLCAPITGQIAAIEALQHGADSVQQMKREYLRRRNFVIEELNRLGLDCHMPEGAFYAFPSIARTGMSSMDFATGLLKAEKVALVPGVAFGRMCDQYIRISYASSYEDLKEAMVRIKRYLGK